MPALILHLLTFPIGRFLGLAWLIAVSLVLPADRRRASRRRASRTPALPARATAITA